MARIDQIIQQAGDEPVFSFEFFPPKTDEGMTNLFNAVSELRELEPSFVSVTYGAGGSTRDRTIAIIGRIKNELEHRDDGALHVRRIDDRATCARRSTRSSRRALQNIIALRGDPPQGETTFTRTEGGLGNADELTKLIIDTTTSASRALATPRCTRRPFQREADLQFAKQKVENGASFLVTQLFFDNDAYFEYVDRARAAGIEVPIVPGIMPIGGYEQIKRFTSMCGASIPERLMKELDARKDDPEAIQDLGVAYATLQCADLLSRGAPGIHFYTLNKSPATRAILSSLRAARPWDRALTPST